MQNPPGGFGALCALHAERTAARTCARCGNFMCEECSLGGSERLCPRCRERTTSFPFDRNTVDFFGVFNHAMKVWGQEWVMLSVCTLILILVGMAANFISSIFQSVATAIVGHDKNAQLAVMGLGAVFGTLLSVLAQGVVQLGFYRVCFDVLQGRKADLSRLFSQTSKVGQYVVQTLVVTVAFTLPLIVFYGAAYLLACKVGGLPLNPVEWEGGGAPGPFVAILGGALVLSIPLIVWFGLPLSFASMELVWGGSDAIEALKRSFTLASGFRLWLFGYILLGSVVTLVGFIACCVGILPAIALVNMMMATFYLAVRNGAGLPNPPDP